MRIISAVVAQVMTLVVVCISALTSAVSGELPITTTICEIRAHPEVCQGKVLILGGTGMGTPQHGFGLFAPSCAKVGVGAFITWPTLSKEPDGAALFRAM